VLENPASQHKRTQNHLAVLAFPFFCQKCKNHEAIIKPHVPHHVAVKESSTLQPT
jgi:hypothetical protein